MEQLTLEQVHALIGKLTLNYELQLQQAQKYIQDLQAQLESVKPTPRETLKEVKK